MFPERKLLLVRANNHSFESDARGLKLDRLIIRKLSYCYELDFHTFDVESDLLKIRNIGHIISIEDSEDSPEETGINGTYDRNNILKGTQKMIDLERYWKAHVLLEMIWKQESGMFKKGIQGIIWLMVSLVHYQMGEISVSEKVFEKAKRRIEDSEFLEISSQLPTSFTYPIKLSLESLLQ